MPSPQPIQDWYRAQEVAAMLGVSPMTIFREIHRGRLQATRVGRLVRIEAKHLSEYLESQKIGSSPDAQGS